MSSFPASYGSMTVLAKPEQIASHVYVVDGTLGDMLPGVLFPVRMTIIRLQGEDRSLLVYSPFHPSLVDLSGLGSVKYIIAPNSAHGAHPQEFQAAHPGSILYSSPALAERFPNRDWGTVLSRNTPQNAICAEVELRVFTEWSLFQEVVLFHVPSKTLIAADMAFNFTSKVLEKSERGFRWFVKLLRAEKPLDWSVAIKLMARSGCKEGIKHMDALLEEWDWDRFVPCHGEVVEQGAKELFREGVYRYVSDVAAGRDWMVLKGTLAGVLLAGSAGLAIRWMST